MEKNMKNHVVVSLNYCSQNGGHLYRAPYYNGNPNRGPRVIGNLDQSPCGSRLHTGVYVHVNVFMLGTALYIRGPIKGDV